MPNVRLLFLNFISFRGFLFSEAVLLLCTPNMGDSEMVFQGHSKTQQNTSRPHVGSPSPEFCCVASWTQCPPSLKPHLLSSHAHNKALSDVGHSGLWVRGKPGEDRLPVSGPEGTAQMWESWAGRSHCF